MRILICAKNDLPALVTLNRLADGLAGHAVTLWLSDVTRPQERQSPELDLLRFFERELPLEWLLPQRSSSDADGHWQDFAGLGRRLGAEVRTVPKLRLVESDFRSLAPDLVISIRFSHIFPRRFLAVPRFGILNAHPGYLPEYAGLFAPFHQLCAGRSRLGCTVHFVDAGIDSGPVVEIASQAVEPHRSLQWHVVNVYAAAIPILRRAITTLAAGGSLPATAQDRSLRRYHHLPDSGQLAALQQRFRLIAPDDFADILAAFGIGPRAAALASAELARRAGPTASPVG